jgi:hypothetical protein
MNSPAAKAQLCEWILRKLEGTLTAQDNEALIQLLKSSPDAVHLYNDIILLYSNLATPGKISLGPKTSAPSCKQLDALLFSMAQAENDAPSLETEPASRPPQTLPAQPVAIEKAVSHINTTSLVTAMVSLAALAIMIVYVILNPRVSTDVATLADSIDAQWSSDTPIKDGGRLVASTPLHLLGGIAKIITDKNVELLLEGPMEFSFDSVSELRMKYGRLTAKVSSQGVGFSVNTPNTKIIDLGTEFGVFSDLDETTELHVFAGKTNLITLQNNSMVSSQMVHEGLARRVNQLSEIQTIALKTESFLRQIDSSHQLILRSRHINLADMVGGGNGTNTGQLNAGINYHGDIDLLDTVSSAQGPQGYIPVDASIFVDGIFIPNGSTRISSQGLQFDFEPTNGRYWLGILNGAWHRVTISAQIPRHNLRLNGVEYGVDGRPAIYLAANQGITFDLEAIRAYYKTEVTEFTALCGISETYNDYKHLMDKKTFSDSPNADFYVLVDGQPYYERTAVSPSDRADSIRISIPAGARFLTLATTQGNDHTNNGDWTLFAEPLLRLK